MSESPTITISPFPTNPITFAVTGVDVVCEPFEVINCVIQWIQWVTDEIAFGRGTANLGTDAPYYSPPSPDYTPTTPQPASPPPAQEPEPPAVAAPVAEREQEVVVIDWESEAEGGASEREEEEVQEQEGEEQVRDSLPGPSCEYSELHSDTEENRQWESERAARLTRFQAVVSQELQAAKIWGKDILKGLPVPSVRDRVRILNKVARKLEKWGEGTVEKYGPKGLRAQKAAQKKRKAKEREIKSKTGQIYSVGREVVEKRRWTRSIEDRTVPEENWWPSDLKEGLEITVLWAKSEPQFQVNTRVRTRKGKERRHIASTKKEIAIRCVLNEVCMLFQVSERMRCDLIDQLYKKD